MARGSSPRVGARGGSPTPALAARSSRAMKLAPRLRLNQAEGRAGNFPVQLAARRLHNRTRRAPPPSLQVRSRAGQQQIGAALRARGAAQRGGVESKSLGGSQASHLPY